MNKEQAIQNFWGSFDIPAFDELSVPDDATLPYITYKTVTDSIGNVVNLSGSIWYKSSRWKEISDKANQIAKYVGYGFTTYKLNDGYMWITKGTPFAQRMEDPNDDMIKRIYINLQAEFLTAY